VTATLRSADVDRAVRELARGRAVVVVRADGTEPPDLVFAAATGTAQVVAFVVRYSSGFLCAAMEPADARRLNLPRMSWSDGPTENLAVSVDAAEGISTGISATDRARTLRLLADPATPTDALSRPGHVVPLIARPHPADAVDRAGLATALAAAAGAGPTAGVAQLVSERRPTEMADREEAEQFARRHGLALLVVDDRLDL
jgi:3,4-dihydroxy 2-butanone 4-phosphate synthase/GTP cyclohydrolase II